MGKLRVARPAEHLVDGLTFDERLARLELRLLGSAQVRGAERGLELLEQRVEELESLERRRKMGWFGRLMLSVTKAGDTVDVRLGRLR